MFNNWDICSRFMLHNDIMLQNGIGFLKNIQKARLLLLQTNFESFYNRIK
jgi:hypothetical protein